MSLHKDERAAPKRRPGGPPPFRRLLIANRGEIAVRIARTCRELGVESVAVFSDADAHALHVQVSERAERIGPAEPGESYLSIERLLDAARRSAAEAVHPGYGFLSENAEFASAVTEAGLVFVGPPPATIAALGDKLAARRAAQAAGVPVVPGLLAPLDGDAPPEELLRSAAAVGLPVMLKAAAGGGGRGMRRVDDAGELKGAIAAASREARAAFGDGTVYLERLIQPVRHVEVQLLGDRHGGLAVLGERDCSVQRRHQKLVEESPSPAVDEELRERLFDSARRIASAVDFHNAATVEMLVDAGGAHYFLEMNTRLQVEHGVTELVTGLDLVEWQLRVAAGERLPPLVTEAARRGHAIEVRVYAEDPWHGFGPQAGRIGAWRMPDGPGIRVDAGVESGSEILPHYDPLLAKLMVVAGDRPAAVRRLRRALDETLVGGLQTDLGFHRWLVDEPSFVDGRYDTSLVAERWGSGPELPDALKGIVAAAALQARSDARRPPEHPAPSATTTGGRSGSAWAETGRREATRRWR